MYALEGILPPEQLKMWEHFVKACSIVCTRAIAIENVQKAHDHFVEFNIAFQNLLGNENCTINMHLHCHLAESIYNLGPIYSFWCFPYERFNGILGSYSTNNHSINIQVMRKFCLLQSLDSNLLDPYYITEEYKSNFESLLGPYLTSNAGSLEIQQFDTVFNHQSHPGSVFHNYNSKDKLCQPVYEGALSDMQLDVMAALYREMYSYNAAVHVPRLYYRSSDIELQAIGERYSSSSSLSKKSHCIYALNMSVLPHRLQLCAVQYYLKHSISLTENTLSEHLLACVKWFDQLPDGQQKCLGDTLDVWSVLCSEPLFISVNQIKFKAATVTTEVKLSGNMERTVVLSIPVNRHCTL